KRFSWAGKRSPSGIRFGSQTPPRIRTAHRGRLTHLSSHRRPSPTRVIFCVQAVISPALANLYMNRMLKGWRQSRRGEQFRARIVNYADDFVILSRGKAKEALEWTRGVLERLELTLNEKKTSVRNACEERFDFLGYTFGPHYSMRTGQEYIGYGPSKKSVARIKEKVGDLLEPSNVKPELCTALVFRAPVSLG